jgi:hypothetical protein
MNDTISMLGGLTVFASFIVMVVMLFRRKWKIAGTCLVVIFGCGVLSAITTKPHPAQESAETAETPGPVPTQSVEEIDKKVAFWNKSIGFYASGLSSLTSAINDGYRPNFDEVTTGIGISDDTAEDWAKENVPTDWQDVSDSLVEGLLAHKQLAEKDSISLSAHPDTDAQTICDNLLKGIPELIRARDLARDHLKAAGGDPMRISLPN